MLYAQMASSAQRVAGSSDPGRRRALTLWWLKLGLNAAWTPVFFGARRTGAAAVVVCACPARGRGHRGRERASTVGPGCSTRPTSRGPR
ncbi:MAG: tryptophan-rich sensory protein, partial [Gaiellaceae bacterium]